MKRALFLLAMLLSALSSFSQIQLGATASYLPTAEYGSWGQPISMSILPVLGLESEYSTGILRIGATGLYQPPFDTQSAQLILHTDIGISDRLAFINIGIGVGPSLVWDIGNLGSLSHLFWNAKLFASIDIGELSIGITRIYNFASTSPYPRWMLSTLVHLS